jgi:hypothetical protein
METDTALLKRKGEILFKFWSMKHQNDRRIGDLTLGDFIEMIAFLNQVENNHEQSGSI